MNKNKKLIIGILIATLIIIGVFVAYKLIEKSVIDRENFRLEVENINYNPVETVNQGKNEKKEETNSIKIFKKLNIVL